MFAKKNNLDILCSKCSKPEAVRNSYLKSLDYGYIIKTCSFMNMAKVT